jgi:predicted SAM-dependent methyltransferase
MCKNLNLGCGRDVRKSDDVVSWTNLDQFAGEGVDLVATLDKPLPFPDDCFDLVHASHILEHLDNYPEAIQEIHRILKPGGVFVVKVPEFPCRAAVADPDHKRYFVPESFYHLCRHDMGTVSEPRIYGLFNMVWLSSTEESRPVMDNGKPGSYFTEIHVEFEAIKEAA